MYAVRSWQREQQVTLAIKHLSLSIFHKMSDVTVGTYRISKVNGRINKWYSSKRVQDLDTALVIHGYSNDAHDVEFMV